MSTASGAMSTTSNITSAAAGAQQPPTSTAPPQTAEAFEIGWMFVQQYYTFLNKEPTRLHCFYAKKSTMIHGYEGETVKQSQGQQEIHKKTLELNFDDCRVLVSNVDSLPSLNGGIIIQVLGEMGNKGGPSQKFAQTFFLAEQINGYYVLNDIFRYLKDDVGAEYEMTDGHTSHEVAVPAPTDSVPEEDINPAELIPTTKDNAIVAAGLTTPPSPTSTLVETTITESTTQPESQSQSQPPPDVPVSVSESEQSSKLAPVPRLSPNPEPKPESKPEPKPESKSTVAPNTNGVKDGWSATTTSPAADPPRSDATQPIQPQSQSQSRQHSPAAANAKPAAAPPNEPVIKSWANMAAVGRDKWGNQASEARGTSVTVAPAKSNNSASSSVQSQQGSTHERPKFQPRDDAAIVYVKGITPNISHDTLKSFLNEAVGTVKSVDLVGNKGHAFVEFANADLAKSAINKNTYDIKGDIINIEERRRTTSGNSRGRGNFRGGFDRRDSGDRGFHGRGNFRGRGRGRTVRPADK